MSVNKQHKKVERLHLMYYPADGTYPQKS